MDIPTHGLSFPTPFLWPLSDVRIDAIPWSRPVIFFPNVIVLALSYAWYFAIQRRKRKRET